MTTMLKRILKGRNQAPKDYTSDLNPQAPPTFGLNSTASGMSTMSAGALVEYNRSQLAPVSSSSAFSVGPAEYDDRIRPDVDPLGHSPVQPYSSTQFPPVPEYSYGQPKPSNQFGYAQHGYGQYNSSSFVSPAAVDYGREAPPMQSPYSHEMGPPSLASPAMVSYGQSPAEIYTPRNTQPPPPVPMPPQAPMPPQRFASYGKPGENVANQRPPYNYQEHNIPTPETKYAPHNEAHKAHSRFENAHPESGNSSASSLYSPPYTNTATNSTAPTSIYSPDRSNYAQNTPNTYETPPTATSLTFPDTKAAPSSSDPNVSKFAIRIFCQRKREEGDTHEESPRDIREFRLANLALIKLAAGGERYVLLDAVFGELDKAIAPLLEKHWYLTLDSTIEDHFVQGGKHVVAITNIMVAYKGTRSTLYADFKKDDDYARFKLEMEFAMNTIRNGSTSSPQTEKPRYRY
ncbi:hypothetical protein TWF481_003845 [Arthrobotrys musiformis]|uniref:Uncharacterized protein n=1 Tax=Arthrobotrys musiformis TaxID=47236 RepID=A0AAV9WHT4_9PEZI